MPRCDAGTGLAAALVVVSVLSSSALAQTNASLAGRVTDSVGAPLGAVVVTARSSVLIEQIRRVVTGDDGFYRLIDLPSGEYTLTFRRDGFRALQRSGVLLSSSTTVAVDAELVVGVPGEVVLVTARLPAVDVQRAQRQFTLTAEQLGALPTTQNVLTLGALIPGIKLSEPDVGGVRSMEQTYMGVHGLGSRHVSFQIDGLNVNGLRMPEPCEECSLPFTGDVDLTQSFHNIAAFREFTYQTAGVSAETSAGGVRLNMLPRHGGNRFSGSGYFGGSAESWQADNLTSEMRETGLAGTDTFKHLSDVTASLGGPLVTDGVWFFGAYRRLQIDQHVIESFFSDGRPAVNDQWIQNATVRLTGQVSPSQKITAYFDRIFKQQSHIFEPFSTEEASHRREPGLNYVAQARWSSTLTSRLLVDAGVSANVSNFADRYQPGVRQESGTAEWFAGASRRFRESGRTTAAVWERNWYPRRFTISASSSYLKGAHAFRAGVQWSFGTNRDTRTANADLEQFYVTDRIRLARPYNTPTDATERLNYDLGLYFQDVWSLGRVTITPGVRFEWLNAELPAQSAPAGRFVPIRHFDRVPDLPDFYDVAPRLGVAYDLFGLGRTALKMSVGRYLEPWTTNFANQFNPMFFRDVGRRWFDLNGDDVAQDEEILALDLGFGSSSVSAEDALTVGALLDPTLGRESNWEYTAAIEHELSPRLTAMATYYRRSFRDLSRWANELGAEDFLFSLFDDPRDNGEEVPIWVLPFGSFVEGDEAVLTNAPGDSRVYDGVEVSFAARFPAGGQFFGGWTMERTVVNDCGRWSGYRNVSPFRFCDERGFAIPFQHEFKVSGDYPLPGGFRTSVALQSYPGRWLTLVWAPDEALDLGFGSTNLIEPGTSFMDRWTQLDLGVSRTWTVSRIRLEGQVTVFNVLNANSVLEQGETWWDQGVPYSVLQPRLLRLALSLEF